MGLVLVPLPRIKLLANSRKLRNLKAAGAAWRRVGRVLVIAAVFQVLLRVGRGRPYGPTGVDSADGR